MFNKPKPPKAETSPAKKLAVVGAVAGAAIGLGELAKTKEPPVLPKKPVPADVAPAPVATEQPPVVEVKQSPRKEKEMEPSIPLPDPTIWSPGTAEELEAYKNLVAVFKKDFNEAQVPVSKDLPELSQHAVTDSTFILPFNGGSVGIKILPDGSYFLEKSGSFDDDIVVDAASLSDALGRKLALAKAYDEYGDGIISQEDLIGVLDHERLPHARQPVSQSTGPLQIESTLVGPFEETETPSEPNSEQHDE